MSDYSLARLSMSMDSPAIPSVPVTISVLHFRGVQCLFNYDSISIERPENTYRRNRRRVHRQRKTSCKTIKHKLWRGNNSRDTNSNLYGGKQERGREQEVGGGGWQEQGGVVVLEHLVRYVCLGCHQSSN